MSEILFKILFEIVTTKNGIINEIYIGQIIFLFFSIESFCKKIPSRIILQQLECMYV